MKCCALNHLNFVIVSIGRNGLRKLILISISLLIAGGVLAKDACEDESFKNKYQSYCAKKGYETISVLCEGSLKNKPRYKEYCEKICDGSIKTSEKNKPMYEKFCKKKLSAKKSKKSKKSDSKNTLVCPKPFFKGGLIAIAYDEKKEIIGEALRRTRNDSVYRAELRAITNCRNRGGVDCQICSFPSELRTFRDTDKDEQVFYNSEGKEIRSIKYSKSQVKKEKKDKSLSIRRQEEAKKLIEKEREKERKLISSIQDSLKELGYYQGMPDGILGPNTYEAIKKFQEDNNIKSVGIPNASLLSKLKRVIERNKRDRIALIKSIQGILAKIGYSVDKKLGTLGVETKTAIKAFQQEKNLQVDGLPSESLLILLQREMKENPPKIDYSKFVITGTGSGLKINDQGYFITNYHVIKQCKHLTLGRKTPLIVERSDALNDISLLKSVSLNKKIKSLSFSKFDPELGEKIFTAGYPYNYILGEINFTSGNVSSEVGLGQNVSQFQLTAPIQPGNSGGPIFNEFGHVLGIAVQRMDSDVVKKLTDSLPQNINFGIKQSVVRKLLDQAEVDFSVGNQMFNTTQKKIATLAKKGTVLISCWE